MVLSQQLNLILTERPSLLAEMPLPLSVHVKLTSSELPQLVGQNVLFLEFSFNFRWFLQLFIRQKCMLPE